MSGAEKQYEVIRKYSIAFLQRHVNGKIKAGEILELEQKDEMLTRYVKAAFAINKVD